MKVTDFMVKFESWLDEFKDQFVVSHEDENLCYEEWLFELLNEIESQYSKESLELMQVANAN